MTWCGSHKTRPLRLNCAWPRRARLGAVAPAGTVAYSASFRTVPTVGGAHLVVPANGNAVTGDPSFHEARRLGLGPASAVAAWARGPTSCSP